MKYLIPVLIIFLSCTGKINKEEKPETFLEKYEREKMGDSIVKEITNRVYRSIADSAGSWKSPVIVTKARIVQKEYSSYKDVTLTFKNVSGKRIDAIKFRWYGLDAFGEPADMGSYTMDGLGSGYDDDPLAIGATRTATWSISSRNVKKITSAFAYEIAFSDGAKWEFDNK